VIPETGKRTGAREAPTVMRRYRADRGSSGLSGDEYRTADPGERGRAWAQDRQDDRDADHDDRS
jgi:hypothetical protein